MCTTVWGKDGSEYGTQYEFSKLVGVAVKRLPLFRSHDGVVNYTEQSLVGRSCLCPVDAAKAMNDAGIKWKREDTGDYVIET